MANIENNYGNLINKEKNIEYKEIFDKNKNEDNVICGEEINEILNEYGRKITLAETEVLVKGITKDDKIELNFNQFVELMEKEKIDINKINKKKELRIYLIMLLYLLSGSCNTIINKFMQNTKSLGKKFTHQKFITFLMFFAEFLCLLLYYIREYLNKNKTPKSIENRTSKKKQAKIYYFLLPSSLDLLASSMDITGLYFLDASIYQMFTGGVITFTTIASIIFLKNKYYRHHFLGIVIVILGLIIIGIKSLIKGNKKESNNAALGIICILLGQIFESLLYIVEEKILKNYKYDLLKAVGVEGMWGSCYYIILLFIFYFIECKSNFSKENLCVEDEGDEGSNVKFRFENAIFAIKKIFHSVSLFFYILIFIIGIIILNFARLNIYKELSATAALIIGTFRMILVWLFFLTMPFVPDDTEEEFHFLQLLGLIIIVLGGLIYYEILVIPFWGFGDNTKKELKKKENLDILVSELKITESEIEDDNEKKEIN